MKTTGAEAIVAFLRHMGVRYLFGLMGSPMFATMDALYRAGDIKFIPSQHEQGAVYMAMGYGQMHAGAQRLPRHRWTGSNQWDLGYCRVLH